MSKRARLDQLAKVMLPDSEREPANEPQEPMLSLVEANTESQETEKPVFGKLAKRRIAKEKKQAPIEISRPYGERGDFEKITVTLPSDVRALLLDESIRRKKDKSPDWPIAAIVREAIASYLTGKN